MKNKIIILSIILAVIPSVANAKIYHPIKIKGYSVHYNFFTHKKH